MPDDFTPSFPPDCLRYVENAYRDARLILEYGSGGSTLMAAQNNTSIITVESSKSWLDSLMAAHREAGSPGQIFPLWADIGKTKEWGHPDGNESRDKWPDYPNCPWKYCREHDMHPDLVMIDGRFRVACFLTSCAYTQEPITLLFDDYQKRRYYHCVNEIIKPVATLDDRMAVFKIEPGLINTQYLQDYQEYFYDPA